MKRVYLDHAASTPVDPRVLRAMRPYFLSKFGNPGSLHSFGQEAIAAVDAARETLARLVGADFREIVFTGSATEANNLALRGAIKAWRSDERNKGIRPRIVTLAIEHESVLETCAVLEREEGAEIAFATPQNIADAIGEDGRTAIVSAMYVNNETGLVQPIAAIAEMVRTARGRGKWPLFHTDAVQAFGYFDCDVRATGADMMTLSAHKICGPKGIGALSIRSRTPLVPVITGGGQEFGLRSGTENVALIVGFAKAAEFAVAARKREAARLASLRQYAMRGIKKVLRDAAVNDNGGGRGDPAAIGAKMAPHILNIYMPGILAEDAIMRLDLAGIAVSSGSACRARASAPSHVLRALGYPESRARSSIRLSFGRTTGKRDIERFLAALQLLQKGKRR